MGRPRLFVSAVSSELAGARRRVAAILNGLGYDTVSEEDFPTGYGELRRWLAEQIDACEGVIQLVGDAYGAEPPASSDPRHPWPDPELGRYSYTQYELLYAWHRANPAPKRTWVILMGPGYPRDRSLDQLDLPPPDRTVPDPAAYQAERRALQRAYADRLTADNHLRHRAGSETELENLLLKLKDELAELRAGETRRERRLRWAIAAVLAGFLVIGGGGWWAYETLIDRTDELATVTTERIRAHLLEAADDTYQRDLEAAEAPIDWQERERLRQAAEAQRDTQLARIDDLAASFAEIERQGEATSVFKELTRILQEPGQGVTQALAYMETKRPDILERVRDRQAAARERDRAELKPLLAGARLYATQGEADAARGQYAEILELQPNWLEAVADNLRFLIDQGDLAVIRGHLVDAKRDFDEALTRAEHLVALEPDNPGWQRDRSVSLNKVGDIQSAQGDLAGALKSYQESQAIRGRLAAADPSNAGWQRDRSVSLDRVGDIQSAQGDLAGALKTYQESQAIFGRLAAADPSNAGWQRDLSVSLDRIGGIQSAQGDLAGALKSYQESQAIFGRLAAADPSNAGWQRDRSVSLNKVGDIQSAQGDLAGALKTYQESQGIAERLAAADPSNAGWQRDRSVSLDRVGDIQSAQGDLAGALKTYQESQAIFGRLAAADPSNAGWQRDLSVSLDRIGDIQSAQGDLAGALKTYQESQAIFGRLAAADPSNAGWQRDLLGESQQGRRHPVRPGGSRGGAEDLPGEPGDLRAPGRRRSEQRRLAARPLGESQQGRRHPVRPGGSRGGAEDLPGEPGDRRAPGRRRPEQRRLAARPLGESGQGRRHPVRPGGSCGGAEDLPGEPGDLRAPGRRRPEQRRLAARPSCMPFQARVGRPAAGSRGPDTLPFHRHAGDLRRDGSAGAAHLAVRPGGSRGNSATSRRLGATGIDPRRGNGTGGSPGQHVGALRAKEGQTTFPTAAAAHASRRGPGRPRSARSRRQAQGALVRSRLDP